MGSGLTFVSYTLAAVAGVCFVSGLAIMSDKGVKQDGKARNHNVDAG